MIQTVLTIVICYVAYCGFLFLMQRQMLFPGTGIRPTTEPDRIAGLERRWLKMSCGRVEAWYLLPERGGSDEPTPAAIFAHGNGEVIDYWPDEFRTLTKLGIGVLLVEYPGYGRSQGSPSERSIKETFIAAYDDLVAREDVDRSRIILIGRSIGGGAVCRLAAERPSAALVLLSSFTSVKAFASSYLAPSFLVRDTFDNVSVVKSYSGPILVIHGKHDRIIPYRHGVALHDAAPQGTMVTYNCGHNDCPPSWSMFWQDVTSFLREAGILRDEAE